MGFVADGGYVVTGTDGALVHKTGVSSGTLKKVAKLLGIPQAEAEKIIPKARSIHIYRGSLPSSKAKKKKR
jgi:hypothetical protein